MEGSRVVGLCFRPQEKAEDHLTKVNLMAGIWSRTLGSGLFSILAIPVGQKMGWLTALTHGSENWGLSRGSYTLKNGGVS